jgi:hypothetical protein
MRVTYGKQILAGNKFTESHHIGLMRTVRARVMGSYWDYDD